MKEREEMYRRNEEFAENETKLNQTLEQLKQQLQVIKLLWASKLFGRNQKWNRKSYCTDLYGDGCRNPPPPCPYNIHYENS